MHSLPRLGELLPNNRFRDWWNSRPIPVPLFSGALLDFLVTVGTTEAGYPPDVVEAVDAFLSLGEADRLAASGRVCAYHREIVEQAERRGVADFLGIEPRSLKEPNDIWQFVTPTGVCVDRREDYDRDVYVTVACDCTWEPEHGLQLVYRRGGQLVRVSGQDGHLTDANVKDLPGG